MSKTTKKPRKRVSKSHIKGWITRRAREAEEERARKRAAKKRAEARKAKGAKKGGKRVQASKVARAETKAKKKPATRKDKAPRARKAPSPARKPRPKRQPPKRLPKAERRPKLTVKEFARIPQLAVSKRHGDFVSDQYWTREDGTLALFPSWARLHPERDNMFRLMKKGDRDGRLTMIVRLLAQRTGLDVRELYTLYYSP
jgi:flagellar biosynthesis GTPase FlhF